MIVQRWDACSEMIVQREGVSDGFMIRTLGNALAGAIYRGSRNARYDTRCYITRFARRAILHFVLYNMVRDEKNRHEQTKTRERADKKHP